MIGKVKQWLSNKWCDMFHQTEHIKIPMYRQGTYEQVGMMLVCKKCIKGG
jgi:hypothetical protein